MIRAGHNELLPLTLQPTLTEINLVSRIRRYGWRLHGQAGAHAVGIHVGALPGLDDLTAGQRAGDQGLDLAACGGIDRASRSGGLERDRS